MGSPDSDEIVTLEQLAAGEAGSEEARQAVQLLQNMPSLEAPQALLVIFARCATIPRCFNQGRPSIYR